MPSIAETARLKRMVQEEKEREFMNFNPRNEPIRVMKVVEKRDYTAMRQLIGKYEKDEDLSKERGYPIWKPASAYRKQRTRTESDQMMTGPLDQFHYYDCDMLDEVTGFPVSRVFKKGEVFLATARQSAWMEKEGYAMPVKFFKNSVDEKTGVTRFDWADKDETLSDENGFLKEKYLPRYASESVGNKTFIQMIADMQTEIESLKAQVAKR